MFCIKKRSSLLLGSLFLLSACGGSGSDKNKPIPLNVSVPTQININIPQSLKARPSQKTENETVSSYGYQQLKSTINEAENNILTTKKNIIYLNKVMPKIMEECIDIEINEECIIPEGIVSLEITDELQTETQAIDDEFNTTTTELPQVTLSLGEIHYIHKDKENAYQHKVTVDLTSAFSELSANITKSSETIQWKDDNSSIEITSIFEELDSQYTMHLNYNKNSDGTVEMKIEDTFSDELFKGNFLLQVKELNDVNNTVQVESSGTFTTDEESDSFNSTGQVSDTGGYLLSTGNYSETIKYAEKEFFDKQGILLQSTFCEENPAFSDETCKIEDESSWHNFDQEFGIDYAEDSNDFDSLDSTDSTHVNSFDTIKIVGGNLKIMDKDSDYQNYEMIPADTNISNDFIKEIIAVITLEKNDLEEIESTIFFTDKIYNGDLNDLMIVYLDSKTDEYLVVEDKDKPTFVLVEE